MSDGGPPRTGATPVTAVDPVLLRRLKWILGIRLAVAVLGMVTVLVREEGVVEFPSRYVTAYSALGLLCVANLAYLVTVRLTRNYALHATVQFTSDAFLVSLMAYATGGVQSVFAPLYFGLIFGSAIILTTRVALVLASLTTVLLSGITMLYFLSAHYRFALPLLKLGPDPGFTSQLSYVLPYLVYYGLSLHSIALLAGRLAAELQRVRIFNEEILQNLAGGIIAASSNGHIAFMNDHVRTLLDLPTDRRATADVFALLRSRPELAPLAALLVDPREITLELVLPPRNGKFRAVEVTSSLLLRSEGRPVRGIILSVHDASDRRLVEDVERKSARLEASSEMAATIAHEIRNPLASIRGAIQELSDGLALSPDDRRLMTVILKESDRLNGIITRFLEYSRLRQPAFSPIDLAPMLREVLFLMEQRDQEKRLAWSPDLPEQLRVTGDADLLKQVFLNLLINAAEASPAGGKIVVRGREASIRPAWTATHAPGARLGKVQGVQVEIVDQGPGITAEALPRIFDPFFTTKPRGTGMGLAVASRIVLAHHGQLDAENAGAQGGARFTVWLPAQRVP